MDTFTDLVVRDDIMLNQRKFLDDQFCLAAIGHDTWHRNNLSQRAGLVVWGQSFDASRWEVTDGFAARWK